MVKGSIRLFENSLTEAILIVLAVSFLSLGWRTGTVVALSIPLVLAITFFLMKVFGIDLQRISLGALVIALGLLVDDAIIAVEMMVVKMEQGWDRFKAATFAYTSTAFPMLTGTLITAAAFTPVGFSKSAASEYTISIFQVVTIALLTSWIVAVVFTPYLGYRLLDPKKLVEKAQRHGTDIYDTPFYRRFRALVTWCLRNRWKVIAATLGIFALSIAAFNVGVQKQFFPAASRIELIVDVWLPQGASLKATEAEARRIERILADDPAVASYSSYIGNGAPRFFLSLDVRLFSDNYAQVVIVTKGMQEREDIKRRLTDMFTSAEGGFSHVHARVSRLENGPPVGYPVQFRVMGEDVEQVRTIAGRVADLMRANAHLQDVSFDWNEKVKALRIEVDQDKARHLGTSSREIAQALQGWLNGVTLAQYREGDQLIDVVWRGAGDETRSLDRLPDLDIPLPEGRHVPLAQVAKLVPVQEEGLVWRRNRLPTMTVLGDMADKTQPATVSMELNAQLDALRATLPIGYRIEMGGSIEESAKGETAIKAVVPLMLTSILCEALMVWLGIGVKVATLPVIALGVGIGIDYALYVMSMLLVHRRQGVSLSEAYYRALVSTGKVVMLTGVTLAIGVITWLFSPIKFQADMGVLLAFMFVWNMVGALLLLPALAYFLLPAQRRADALGASQAEAAVAQPTSKQPSVSRVERADAVASH